MPGVWDRDAFVESGFDSIKKFSGTLVSVEEDVEGDYGSQIAFRWSNVEILEADCDIVLEDGEFTKWLKQSSRKNSMNQKVVDAYLDFKDEAGLDGDNEQFAFLHDTPAVYEMTEFEFGKNRANGEVMTGRFPIPVEIVEDKPKKKLAAKPTAKPVKQAEPEEVEEEAPKPVKKAAPAKSKPAPVEEPEEVELPEALVDAVIEAVGEDGATEALITAALKRKAVTRKALAEFGEIADLLGAMVEGELLTEDDGTYTA